MLIAFNKPFGVVSQFTPAYAEGTASARQGPDGSPNRTLAEFGFPKNVYPIGRLDADSEGLLLLSDEPGWSERLLNPRHAHEWKVWKDVKLPEGKILVPGVVSHGTNVVEHPELVAERILNFAGCVGRENVIAGTDCGFAQEELNRRVHPSIMWAKLESMAEGARLASAELWGRKAQA